MSIPISSTDRAGVLAGLAAMQEAGIDVSDIPSAPDANWADARRPNLYRPIKQAVSIRLDADVIAWFREKAGERGYQTLINEVLRREAFGQP